MAKVVVKIGDGVTVDGKPVTQKEAPRVKRVLLHWDGTYTPQDSLHDTTAPLTAIVIDAATRERWERVLKGITTEPEIAEAMMALGELDRRLKSCVAALALQRDTLATELRALLDASRG